MPKLQERRTLNLVYLVQCLSEEATEAVAEQVGLDKSVDLKPREVFYHGRRLVVFETTKGLFNQIDEFKGRSREDVKLFRGKRVDGHIVDVKEFNSARAVTRKANIAELMAKVHIGVAKLKPRAKRRAI